MGKMESNGKKINQLILIYFFLQKLYYVFKICGIIQLLKNIRGKKNENSTQICYGLLQRTKSFT